MPVMERRRLAPPLTRPSLQYFSCRKISHTQTALNPDAAISQCKIFRRMVGAWGNGAAAPAVLARDALASSVDKQHEDDDEAVDHLPASLGHFHDRKHAVE